MDPYDEEILDALKDGNLRGFTQILDKASFSHNTLRLHLNSMVEKGLIIREKSPSKRRGRPIYLYRISTGALASASGDRGRVVVVFQRFEASLPLSEGWEVQEDWGQM